MWTKVHQVSFGQRGRGCCWSAMFQIFDVATRSGDIRDEICQKSRRNLEVFWPSQILGGGTSKSYTHFITPDSRHVGWKKFCEDTSTSAEVIGAHTLNFWPNFKFSRLNCFRGAPLQLWCALASLGQSVSYVKIWGGSTPKGRNVVSRKMSAWVGQYEPL